MTRQRRCGGPPNPNCTHGIRSTYAHGCRCDPCRTAEREYKRDLRARQRGRAAA